MRRTPGSLLLPLLLCGAFATPVAAQDPQRARQLLERAGCQTSLPGEHEGAGSGSGGPLGSRRRPGRDDDSLSFSFGGGGALADILLWTVLGGATVLLIVAVVRGLGDRRRPVTVRTSVTTTGAAPAPAEPAVEPLPDHARLAAAGAFAEALHAVLQQAIVRFVERGGRLPRHCTARGALARITDAALPRDAFGHLVAATEVVRYAGRAADRSAYEAACLHLQQWEDACRSRT